VTEIDRRMSVLFRVGCLSIVSALLSSFAAAEPVATWLFDEWIGVYPSCVLNDTATGRFPLVLGRGGQIVDGRFGNALAPMEQPPLELRGTSRFIGFEKRSLPRAPGARSSGAELLAWPNAMFSALMTRGANHLRKEVGFGSPTRSKLNLGGFDWTVEFWFAADAEFDDDGVVFEIGSGPRGTNKAITRLAVAPEAETFVLSNRPSGTRLTIPSDRAALAGNPGKWHHFAFVYDATANQLRHYVDGRLQKLPDSCSLTALEPGEHDYMVIGRDGAWRHALPGRLDELRFSTGQVYQDTFSPPESFSKVAGNRPVAKRHAGPPLLFADGEKEKDVVALGSRKHLFIDNAIVSTSKHVEFTVNPPRRTERVIDRISGHLVVFPGEGDEIRLYYRGPQKSLAVLTSTDGVNWKAPDLGREFGGVGNVVIEDPVGMGTLFVDPNAPPAERIKYVSGFRGRGIYVYSSPDGIDFRRSDTSVLPFRAASQSIVYYDDQRQVYVGYHRSDAAKTVGGKTSRSFVMTEATDVDRPWPFRPLSIQEQEAISKTRRLSDKIPYYLDNGPLTPPGFGVEYPTIFAGDESLDPLATDIYVPKCVKYAWAPDTYLAFPVVYFHYHGDGPETRRTLGDRARGRGSGPLETQLATSRDGISWKRYPRPAYIDIGTRGNLNLHRAYIAHGMIRRGDEIWQYFLGEESYHSPWQKAGEWAVV